MNTIANITIISIFILSITALVLAEYLGTKYERETLFRLLWILFTVVLLFVVFKIFVPWISQKFNNDSH